MKLYTRIIAMLCALVMLVACFASCAETGNDDTTSGQASTTVSAEPVETTDPRYDDQGYWKDDLPDELDYKNETVSILYWSDVERAEFEITEDEADSDMVKEAIYRRNLATEERLGVTFEWVGQEGNSSKRANFTNYVLNCYSGGTYYDIIATYSRTAGMLLTNGLIQDLNSIEDSYINIEQPWWPASMVDTCAIDNSLFFVSGDISTNVLHFMYAVYYNMDMLNNLGLSDPVAMVDNKTWTIDALIELSSELYQDLDQSGDQSDLDQYGFCTTYFHLDAFYTGSDMMCLVPGTDTYIAISEDYFGQKTVDLVDKLSAWFKAGDSYINPYGGDVDYDTPFEEGNCLFCLNRVYMADNEYGKGTAPLRNADWEYGILPVPLYDESQENYITVVGNPFTLWSVMQNAKDPSMSTAVIECLASEAYRKTSPTIFENNMKYRYTPDAAGKGDSARMFDIVRESIAFDLGRIFSDSMSMMSELPSRTASQTGSWATMKAQYERTFKRSLSDLNKSLEKVLDQ